MHPQPQRLTQLLMILLLLCIAGCDLSADGASAKPTNDSVSAYVDVINYRHDHNYGFTLIDMTISPNQNISGGTVWPLASGGSVNCCIQLPTTWHANMKVRVKWDDYIKQSLQGRFERELEIPRYAQPGNLYVVFGADQQPEIVISSVEPGHPAWPGKIKQTPWDYCESTYGRKACKAAMPKRFSAGSNQGFCTSLKEDKDPKADFYCGFSMNECMRDYEDEAFCKKILWGVPKK